jgi:hypothetical protein
MAGAAVQARLWAWLGSVMDAVFLSLENTHS